ncbi:MAG: toll/interleukin-1 receptor domain-containing protein [Dokdonella sp.]
MVADEPDTGFRYWAFISYSHQDTSWARWLHRALESYRIPRRLIGLPIGAGTIPPRLTPVFRDRDELPTATDLHRSVTEALQQSWCLIVICSPASAQSRWVNEEVRQFQRLGRSERIHCLIVDSADGGVPCFPPALRERSAHEVAAAEPIAADARRGGDGKAHAQLKLIAGILGISFDKLAQREQQRGYRRMAIIAAAAVFALVLLSVFTVVTVTSRREAEAQRGHAEGLVEFMLGDLHNRLAPEGHLATLDAVGKEALAYYAAQEPASLDADALARRARALHMIGEVYDQRGRLDDALDVFAQAAATTAELLARDTHNAQRIFDHAQSVYWVGYIAWQRGHADIAQRNFESYRDLAQRLVAIDPAKSEWQAEVEYAQGNLGTLWLDQGRAADAATAFTQALQVAEELNRRAPNDAARQIELAQSHAWLADAQVAQGRLAEAAAQRQAETAIYEDVLALNPKNMDAKNALLVAERELGGLAMIRGERAMALSQLHRAVTLADELLASDADNTASAQNASAAFADLGEALDDGGEGNAARAAVTRARAIATHLVERDPSVVMWQARLCRSLLLQAQLTAAGGDPLEALRQVQGVIQRLDTLRQSGRLDRHTHVLYAKALLAAGDQNDALGNHSEAREDWLHLVEWLRGDVQIAEPQMQAILAIALQALDEADQSAAPIIARLDEMGYREPRYQRWRNRNAVSTKSQVRSDG